jgi:hypothetical protein
LLFTGSSSTLPGVGVGLVLIGAGIGVALGRRLRHVQEASLVRA